RDEDAAAIVRGETKRASLRGPFLCPAGGQIAPTRGRVWLSTYLTPVTCASRSARRAWPPVAVQPVRVTAASCDSTPIWPVMFGECRIASITSDWMRSSSERRRCSMVIGGWRTSSATATGRAGAGTAAVSVVITVSFVTIGSLVMTVSCTTTGSAGARVVVVAVVLAGEYESFIAQAVAATAPRAASKARFFIRGLLE